MKRKICTSMRSVRSLVIHASDVAALCNLHRYQPMAKTFEKVGTAFAPHLPWSPEEAAPYEPRVVINTLPDDAVNFEMARAHVHECVARVVDQDIAREQTQALLRAGVTSARVEAPLGKHELQQMIHQLGDELLLQPAAAVAAQAALEHQNEMLGDAGAPVLLPADALGERAPEILAQRQAIVTQAQTEIVSVMLADAKAKRDTVPEATRKAVGTAFERVVRDEYIQQTQRSVVDGNTRRYQKRQLWIVLGTPVFVGGRCDGVEVDPGTGKVVHLVEIKTRASRLFDTIPLYELVQLHVYMFVHGLAECTHVQRYKDETDTTVVSFNQALWNTAVLPRLKAAAHNIVYLAQTPDAMAKFCADRAVYFAQYLPPPAHNYVPPGDLQSVITM